MAIYRGDGTPTAGDDLYDQADLDTAVAAAAASEAAASASETAAAASAAAASTSETNAAASAGAASTSETNAAASEAAAAASASAASTSETNAAASEAAAAASYDSFDDRYLGAKASDPALDNDGNALLTGALYWNTTSGNLLVYDGAAWNALEALPSISANALKHLRVNAGETATEWYDLFGTASTWTAQMNMVANGGSMYTSQAYDVAHDSAFQGFQTRDYLGVPRGFVGSIPSDGASYVTMYTWDTTLGTPAWNRVFGAAPNAGDLELGATNITWEGNVIANLATAQSWTGAQTFASLIISDPTVDMTDSAQSVWIRGNDTGFTSVCGGSAVSGTNGARVTAYGNSHATYPGHLYLVPGTAGEVYLYNGAVAKVLETVTGGVQVNGNSIAKSTTGAANFIANSATGATPSVYLQENSNNKLLIYHDWSSHNGVIRKYLDATPGTAACQIILYDNGGISLNDAVTSKTFVVGAAGRNYDFNGEEQLTYAGRVTSTGTAERLPSGWSSSRTTDPGRYRITHNLGTTAYTVTGIVRSSAAGTVICYTYTSTYIDIWTFNAAGTATNYTFHFMVQLH